MLGLIIYGTRGITSTLDQGRFHCPSCGPDRIYSHKQVRRFFTLYFIPLIPLDRVGTYIECTRGCRQTFREEVLDFDPNEGREEAEAEFRKVMLQVMVDIMMADGELETSELKTVAGIYEKVGGKPLSQRRLDKHLAQREATGTGGTAAYLEQAQGFLNAQGKELVIRAALAVAAADGEFQQEEQELIFRYARALGIRRKQYAALVAEVFQVA